MSTTGSSGLYGTGLYGTGGTSSSWTGMAMEKDVEKLDKKITLLVGVVANLIYSLDDLDNSKKTKLAAQLLHILNEENSNTKDEPKTNAG